MTAPGPDRAPQDRPSQDRPLRTARLRRAPRYGAFAGAGLVLGLLAAGALTFAAPATDQYGYGAVLGYLAVALGCFGALVGAAAAVVAAIALDRRQRRLGAPRAPQR